MIPLLSHSPAETKKLARDFAKRLVPPVVVGLFGDLAAGKTTFVQGLGEGLGVAEALITSPTFTLIQEYPGRGARLIHVDLYRLEHPAEIESLGLDEYLVSPNVVVIEWAERFKSPLDFEVRFEIVSENERRIDIHEI